MTGDKVIPKVVEKFLNEITKKYDPNIKIGFKSDSWLMKVIAFVVKPFSPTFMTDYVTVLGSTIWCPDTYFQTQSETTTLKVVTHETQHLIDKKKFGSFLFTLLYGCPQILALLSVFSLGGLVFQNAQWLLWLLWLVFLAPIPAYTRYRLELNGYRTFYIFANYVDHSNGKELAELDSWTTDQLAGKWYYFTWPFPKFIKKDIQDTNFMTEPRYKELIDWLETNKISS